MNKQLNTAFHFEFITSFISGANLHSRRVSRNQDGHRYQGQVFTSCMCQFILIFDTLHILSSNGPRISPLSFEYKCPRLSLLIIKSILKTNKIENDFLFYYSMHEYSSIKACFEHSNFFKVNLPAPNGQTAKFTR